LTRKSELKRAIIQDIKEIRAILTSMEQRARSNDAYQLALSSTFFYLLKHHLEEGDLTPEFIDLALNLKHHEFLRQQEETE
jgi:lipoprotein NlpI